MDCGKDPGHSHHRGGEQRTGRWQEAAGDMLQAHVVTEVTPAGESRTWEADALRASTLFVSCGQSRLRTSEDGKPEDCGSRSDQEAQRKVAKIDSECRLFL